MTRSRFIGHREIYIRWRDYGTELGLGEMRKEVKKNERAMIGKLFGVWVGE